MSGVQQHTEKLQPGFPCPECSAHIRISMDMLFADMPIICDGCGLELNLEEGKSRKGLKSIGELEKGLRSAERIKEATMPPTFSSRSRRSRRVPRRSRRSKNR